ncbi:hypothetical protein ACVH8U_003182 [Yersinia enterocolitica]|nr:hypothetical protein [Yersinia enterocolitica]
MITHSPHTIANRTERIGCFTVPGVLGGFEVRSMKNRKERPLLMVVRTGWEKAAAYEQIHPVSEIVIEKNGNSRPVNQAFFWNDLQDTSIDFSQKAVDLFFSKKGTLSACHPI